MQAEFAARPAPDLILIRHEAIAVLGMPAMELMAVTVRPEQVDPLALVPGERVRLVVRPRGDALVLERIERR